MAIKVGDTFMVEVRVDNIQKERGLTSYEISLNPDLGFMSFLSREELLDAINHTKNKEKTDGH